MSFSRKAIVKLLPFMEQGCLTSEAIEKAGYRRNDGKTGQAVDKLPLPPDLRNPIFQKALFEVRKVINAIVRNTANRQKLKSRWQEKCREAVNSERRCTGSKLKIKNETTKSGSV